MQNLIIDIGNTNIKLGIFHQNQIAEVYVVNELDLNKIAELIQQHKISNSILSSVADFDSELLKILKSITNFIHFDWMTKIPIINNYETPKTLGKDRLANAIGAKFLFPNENCLIIDAGTCLKFDFINKDAVYWGGSISPGLQMKFNALNKFTFKLPLIKLSHFEKLIGQNTDESILSGVINGTIAEIEGLIKEYIEQIPDIKIILTGGDSFYLEKRLKKQIFAVPNIGLIGLNYILTYNASKN